MIHVWSDGMHLVMQPRQQPIIIRCTSVWLALVCLPPTNLYITSLHIYTWKLFSVQYPSPHPLQTCCWCVSIYSILKLSRVCPWKVLHVLKLCMGSMMMSYMTMSLTENKYFKIFHILLVQRCWCGIWPGQCPLALCYPDQCPPWLGPAWLCLTEMCNKTVTNH